MENDEAKIADRNSFWGNLSFLSDKKAQISLDRKFTEVELEKISYGTIPENMDSRWFIFLENHVLYFHRSWTGMGIYEVHFEKEGDLYKVAEAWVSEEENRYKKTDDNYTERFLLFLIEYLLLGKTDCPYPKRDSV